MALNKQTQAKIATISRNDVLLTLGGLRPFLCDRRWIGERNRYATNTISQIRTELAGTGIRAPKQLSQYIVASTVLHCTDGWSYFGAAVASLLRGDPHRTRHLAYYAELRAAMSLLAAFGVGVFNEIHFIVDAPDSSSALPRQSRTHQFVWDCVEYLATQTALGTLFSSIIKPYGRTLGDWLDPVGGGAVIAPQAQHWLLQWGQDLQMPEKDRNARNESSYRPDGIPDGWYLCAPNVLNFVYALWASLEPSPHSRFSEIDTHILRVAVERSYPAHYGMSKWKKRGHFKRVITQLVERQSLDLEVAKTLTEFLLRRVSRRDNEILLASRRRPDVRDGSDFAIVARAVLLLRAASGSALKLLSDAGIDAEAIRFWRDGLGFGRGLLERNEDRDPLDLWADVQMMLDDIKAFDERTDREDQTFCRVARELGNAIFGLGNGERVAVWSLSS